MLSCVTASYCAGPRPWIQAEACISGPYQLKHGVTGRRPQQCTQTRRAAHRLPPLARHSQLAAAPVRKRPRAQEREPSWGQGSEPITSAEPGQAQFAFACPTVVLDRLACRRWRHATRDQATPHSMAVSFGLRTSHCLQWLAACGQLRPFSMHHTSYWPTPRACLHFTDWTPISSQLPAMHRKPSPPRSRSCTGVIEPSAYAVTSAAAKVGW